MKDIKMPGFIREAMPAREHGGLFYLCITLILFLAGSLLGSFIQVPGMMAYLMSDSEYRSILQQSAVNEGQMANMMNRLTELLQSVPDWLTIVMLCSEVALILVCLAYCCWGEKRKLSSLGVVKKHCIRQYLLGLVLGAVVFCAAVAVCLLTGSVRFLGRAENVVPLYIIFYFVGYMFQGMAEEILCRGYLFVSLSRRHRVVSAALISAVFFAVLHGMNHGIGPIALLNLFLFGLFMAGLFLVCENIWVVGAVHTAWNFVQGNIFGIQVSGMQQQNAVFRVTLEQDKSLLHGGGFGLEGGLAVTIVLVCALVLLGIVLQKQGKITEGMSEEHTESVQSEKPSEDSETSGTCQAPEEAPERQGKLFPDEQDTGNIWRSAQNSGLQLGKQIVQKLQNEHSEARQEVPKENTKSMPQQTEYNADYFKD